MWPWAHLAVGYLVYSAFSRFTDGRRPGTLATVAVALGTQFPDLVDKPLAYSFAILPEGRSLAHSLLFLVPTCLVVLYISKRLGHRKVGLAFGIGYATHPFADGYGAILSGEWSGVSYLLYPILPSPDYEAESFGHHGEQLAAALNRLDLQTVLTAWHDGFVIQLWIALAVALLWILDGMPPFGYWSRNRNQRADTNK